MKQLIKIINVITNRATPYDICELLEQDYFSNSRQENIKYGDMDLFHFIRVFINKNAIDEDDVVDKIKRILAVA